MKYLLDVNALIALGFIHHEFHDRVTAWIKAQRFPELATCSITELGFVRVLSQAPVYGFTTVQARNVLLRMKKAKVLTFTFIADSHDISYLPAWVKSPRQTTDGHLVELARVSGAILATLDEKVPGSYRIP
jgi:predicted nucleic acid-binding protein